MDQACPVTKAFLAGVRSHPDLASVLYEEWYGILAEFEEQAERGGNQIQRQHQRAFLCIELMLYRVARRIDVAEAQVAPTLIWPRSREGLTRVVQALREDNENLLGAQSEYIFSRGISGKGADQLIHTNQRRALVVYKLAGESAVILRRALCNPRVSLARVGRRLASAMAATGADIHSMLVVAGALLEQTENWAPRIWELHPK